MALGEVYALRGSLSRYVSVIQEFGSSYFLADAAWDEFPLRVQLLKAQHECLETHFEKYGLSHNPSFLEAVKEARKLLDREVAKLEKRSEDGCCPVGGICHSVSGMLFPKSVGLHLRVARAAYESILEHIRTQPQLDEVFNKSAFRRSLSLPFRKDSHYVPLRHSEGRIYSALEAAPALVLLHGAPGKGKSTLARQVSLWYKEEKSTFTQVVMLECGPNVDVAAKKTDLLQKLGWDLTSERSQGDDLKVVKLLQTHLKKQKILIVLDDLWENELIHSLLNLSGSGVKYLITSQLAHLCDGLHVEDKTLVPIEDLRQDDSRKILATHVGFEDQAIPHHLQEVADKIRVQAGENPLVMATLGAQIANAGRDSLEVWESVSDDLFELLDSKTRVNVHGIGYERSFLATMKISTDALSHKQKQLFVLMGMCRGPSISKPALQYLYSSTISREKCNMRKFLTLSNELKSRYLLAENDTELFSIHSLTKGFILDQMRDIVNELTAFLNETNFGVNRTASNRRIRISVTDVLVYLYIDVEFSKRATVQIGSCSNSYVFCESKRATIDTKITTCESIMQLLVLEARSSNEWTEELSTCAKQVLVEFVCNDLLCDGDISQLLDSPVSIIPILTFLKNVCLLQESFWKKNSIQCSSEPNTLQSLLHILRDNSRPLYQAQAALVLKSLCWSHANKSRNVAHANNSRCIASLSGMLPQLAMSLAQDQNPDLQRHAAMALSACAYWDAKDRCDTIIPKILDVPRLLNSLVKLLTKVEDPGVKTAAGHAIDALTFTIKSTRIEETTLSQPGLLVSLGDALMRSQEAHLQESLDNITNTNENAALDNVLNHSELLDKLVTSLYEDQNPDLQEESAWLFFNLPKYRAGSGIFDKLADWPGLVEGLVNSLLKAQDASLQTNVLRILCRITYTNATDSIRHKLLTYPGLVDKMVKLLDNDSNASLQRNAARILGILTTTGTNRELVQWPGLLEGLTKSLIKSDHPLLQEIAAATLANIAYTDDSTTLNKLLNHSGLVDKLVKALYAAENSALQERSARAIGNLARYRDQNNIRHKVANWPGLLEGLVESLLKAQNPSLQETAAKAIALLAFRIEKEVANSIVNQPGLVDSLLKLLGENHTSGVRAAAAAALCSLTHVSKDNLKAKIVGFPWLLETVTQTLVVCKSPTFDHEEVRVAGILSNLAITKEMIVLSRIVALPGWVGMLAKCMTKNQNALLQIFATMVLLNLAGGKDNNSYNTSTFPGLLERLAEGLLQGENLELQNRVRKSLIHLISTKENGTVNSWEALNKFIKTLTKY